MRPPVSSSLNDPALRQALAAYSEIAQPLAQAAPPSPLPASALSDARVQKAYEALAQLEPVPYDKPEPSAAPGSGQNDARVQSALSGLAGLAPPDVQPKPEARGTISDAGVANAVQALGQGDAPANLITIKNALNGGELSPDMLARYDLPRYQMGCEKLLNMIPLPGGGITRRPGFAHVGVCGRPGYYNAVRLVPFLYSAQLSFMLIFVAYLNSGLLWFARRDGTAIPQSACAFPYLPQEINNVSFCQCGKYLYAAHENHPPARFVFDGTTFRYEQLDFNNRVPVPDIIGFSFEGHAQENTSRNLYYRVTAVDPVTGRESLPGPEHVWFTCTLNSSFSALIKIRTIPGISEYRIYKRSGGEYGFIGRLLLPDDYVAPAEPPIVGEGGLAFILGTEPDVFHDAGITPDTADQPPREQHFFEGPGDYPSVVFLHQQRLGWASTKNEPLTLWLSQTSAFDDLSSKQPPRDDDGIEATLASTQANRILWAVSDRTGLAIGTAGEEWYLTGASGEGSMVTHNSLSFQPQTRYGSQPGLPALRADASILFLQAGGRAVRDLGYSFSADRYEARDLTLLARRLFRFSAITSWAWQGYPMNILWCCLASGRLAGLTYMPDQEIIAWHRHETQGSIRACATLADSAGRSRLWLVTERQTEDGGEYHVEIMGEIHEGAREEWDGEGEDAGPQWLDGREEHPYKARCIPCLPEAGMENGATSLRVRKINAITCRAINSAPFKCQVTGLYAPDGPKLPVPHRLFDFNTRDRQTLERLGFVPGLRDWSCPLGAGFRSGARLELVFDEPRPATLLGISVTMDVAREGSGQI